MNPADLVLDAAAVARLTRLVQVDEMPVGVLRERLLDRYGDQVAAELLRCPWCLSPHLAVLAVLARWRFPRVWTVVARVAAGSLVAGLVAEWMDRG